MSLIVPGIVLAGGRSTRMGRPKALLPVGRSTETFVGRIVRVLREASLDDVVVVVGHEGPAIEHAFGDQRPPRLVVNPNPERGQISSLLAGLRVVDRPGVSGVLVTLVDVPMITAETVRVLREAYARTRAPVVRPVHAGRHGHPVIFDRSLFGELRAAAPETGAKPVVHRHRHEAVEVPIGEEGPFTDIDTPDDFAREFGVDLQTSVTGR